MIDGPQVSLLPDMTSRFDTQNNRAKTPKAKDGGAVVGWRP